MESTDLAMDMKVALRRFAKAVSVITCQYEDRRYAMTATAISEVSTSPPSLLICVNASAAIHEPLAAGAGFCINIMHVSHREIAQMCGGGARGEERFIGGDWRETPTGALYLADAQASFVCRQDGAMRYGTHGIFIGRLEEVKFSAAVDPLIYANGRYTELSAPSEIAR